MSSNRHKKELERKKKREQELRKRFQPKRVAPPAPTVSDYYADKSNLPKGIAESTVKIVTTPDDVVKISTALFDVMEPFLKYKTSLRDRNLLAGMTMIAWNTTLESPERQVAILDGLVKKFDSEEHQEFFGESIRVLMARKQLLYPDDRRKVYDAKFRLVGDDLRLAALADLDPLPPA